MPLMFKDFRKLNSCTCILILLLVAPVGSEANTEEAFRWIRDDGACVWLLLKGYLGACLRGYLWIKDLWR